MIKNGYIDQKYDRYMKEAYRRYIEVKNQDQKVDKKNKNRKREGSDIDKDCYNELIMFYYGKSGKNREYLSKLKDHYKKYYFISSSMKFFDIKLCHVFDYDDKVYRFNKLNINLNHLRIYHSIQKLKEKNVDEEDFLFVFKNIKSTTKSENFALKCIFEFLFDSEFKGWLIRLLRFLPVLQLKREPLKDNTDDRPSKGSTQFRQFVG